MPHGERRPPRRRGSRDAGHGARACDDVAVDVADAAARRGRCSASPCSQRGSSGTRGGASCRAPPPPRRHPSRGRRGRRARRSPPRRRTRGAARAGPRPRLQADRGRQAAGLRRSRAQREAAVDDERLPADHLGVRRAEERRRRAATSSGSTSRPGGLRRAQLEHRLAVREVLSAPVSTTPAGNGVDADAARRRARRRGSGRATRAPPSRCRRARSSRARATTPRLEMATIDEPARHRRRRRARRARGSARAFAPSVQSQCLSSVSSAGRMTPVAALWTSASSGPSAGHLAGDALGRDVAAHEHRLGAELAQLLGRLLGGARRSAGSRSRPAPRRGGRSGARSPCRCRASRR